VTDFTIILRSLRARLFSTLVTVLSVGVAVALMVTLLAMNRASREAFTRGGGNMDLLVSGDSSPLAAVLNGVFYARAPSRPIPWARYERIAADPKVDWAVPLQQGDSYKGQPVVGTTPEMFTKFRPSETRAYAVEPGGRVFERDFEAVAGAQAARRAGLRVGDKVHLTHGTSDAREAHTHEEFTFTVVGVLEPTGTPHDRAVFVSLNSAWMVHAHERREREGGHDADHDADHDHDHDDHDHDHDQDHANPTVELTDADRLITGIYVKTASRAGRTASAAMPQLAAELRRDAGLTVASPSGEMAWLLDNVVSNVGQIFLAMTGVVILSSGVGIMLSLYNSMAERRRQIAVLRVLGCSRGRVFGLVVTESALIGLMGAGLGVLLALAGGAAVGEALRRKLGLIVEASYGPEWVLGVALGTVLLGALAGVIPAILAYRTPVANNLRPIG
jgi:putative ABC transport system permease protein